MAITVSTGFEGPWSNRNQAHELFGVPILKPIFNKMWFNDTVFDFRLWNRSGGSYQFLPGGGGENWGLLHANLNFLPSAPAANQFGRNTIFSGRGSSSIGPVITLSAASYSDGFYCSYNTYLKPPSARSTNPGDRLIGAIHHRNRAFFLGWKTQVLSSPAVGSTGFLYLISAGSQFFYPDALEWATSDSINLLNISGNAGLILSADSAFITLCATNDIAFGITTAGEIQIRLNGTQVSYDTGQTWNPQLSDYIGVASWYAGGSVSNEQTSHAWSLDNITITNELSGVDDSLPPIYQGYCAMVSATELKIDTVTPGEINGADTFLQVLTDYNAETYIQMNNILDGFDFKTTELSNILDTNTLASTAISVNYTFRRLENHPTDSLASVFFYTSAGSQLTVTKFNKVGTIPTYGGTMFRYIDNGTVPLTTKLNTTLFDTLSPAMFRNP